ncbi:helix-turn-helix domain-containing protein [Streptomyces sp. NPDC046887]|uniref:helix-turn-helix domain-containing protein n=1 Tax=Streptomyces sp. NPDC046887 TaxID=3155472 RepID=UPI0033FF4624
MTTHRPLSRSAWSEVPPRQVDEFAHRVLAESDELAHAILREIRQDFPHLRLVEDETGEPLALVGIRRAIEGFVQHLAAGAQNPRVPPAMFQQFGRGEVRVGRSLDSLQAVYRLGVRLSWRRFADIGQQVGIAAPAMYELAESGFEYLDGLVEQSVRGYAEAAARRAGERLRLQKQLIDLLLTDHHADPAAVLGERAARVGWELPETVCVGLLVRPAREAVAPAVGEEILLDMDAEQPRVVVPEPDTPGRLDLVERAAAGWSGALGPVVPLARAAVSLRWAATAVRLVENGALPAGRVLNCTDHTQELLLLPSLELIDAAAARRLAPLDAMSPAQADRTAATLLAWIETTGGAPEVAQRLDVHPQTARARLRQVRELWGDALDDPDRRFEMLLLLRARRLRRAPE